LFAKDDTGIEAALHVHPAMPTTGSLEIVAE
jgi:hypothetical protein